MRPPVWILREAVLALHEQLVTQFGGADGIRDVGVLDSALARPENQLAYEAPTRFALAASYAFGLVKNHPFVDGKKRIGFAVSVLFLELNGYRFEAPEAEAVIETLRLAAGESGESEYAAWLKAHSKPRKTRRK